MIYEEFLFSCYYNLSSAFEVNSNSRQNTVQGGLQ